MNIFFELPFLSAIPFLYALVLCAVLYVFDGYIERFFAVRKPFVIDSIRSTIYETVKITDILFYIVFSLLIVQFTYTEFLPTPIEQGFVGVLLVYLARIAQRFSIFTLAFYIEQKTGQSSLTEIELLRNVGIFHIIIRVIVWISALFLYLSYLAFDISQLVTTFGISSIVIAFALQNVLQDLFSSLSVYLDKPFEVGDYIKTEMDEGVVEKVGIKSTRMRAKTGEVVVIPNKILSETKVRNFRQLEERRVFNTIHIKPTQNSESIARFILDVQQYLRTIPEVVMERVSIVSILQGSIPIEMVYVFKTADYVAYAQMQTELHMFVIQSLTKHTLYLCDVNFNTTK